MGLPRTRPGMVLGLSPLPPTPDTLPSSCPRSLFLPFPAHPPDFRASRVFPAGKRAPSTQPAIYYSISLPVLLFSLPHISGFPSRSA